MTGVAGGAEASPHQPHPWKVGRKKLEGSPLTIPTRKTSDTYLPYLPLFKFEGAFSTTRPQRLHETYAMGVLNKHEEEEGDEYSIKPQAVAPAIDTSQWPLLLKNFDRRQCYFLASWP